MLFSCSKEEQDLRQAPYLSDTFAFGEEDYEIYDPMGDLEDEIVAALMHFEDDNGLGTTDINRGIWTLETGLNYLHGNLPHTHDSMYTVNLQVEFERLEDDMVYEAELKQALILWNAAIGNEELTQYVKFASADVYFDEEFSNSESIFFGIRLSFFTGVVTEDGADNLTLTIPSIPSADATRFAGTKNTCNTSGPSSIYNAQRIANQAFAALPKYTAPLPTSNPVVPFFTNVRDYSSMPGTSPHRLINGSVLFGKSNAPIAGQTTPQSIYTCLSIQEQNTYAQEIYDAVDQILWKHYGVMHIQMEVDKHTIGTSPNIPLCNWEFLQVRTAFNGWLTNNIPTLSYL